MTKTKKEKIFSSILAVDERYIAALPYLLWLVYHLMASLLFFIGTMTAGKADPEDLFLLYINNYWSYIDIILAMIPLTFCLIERKSRLVLYYSAQYLIVDLICPMIVLIFCMAVLSLLGMSGVLPAIIISGISQLLLLMINIISLFFGFKQIKARFGLLSLLPEKLALRKGGNDD